MTEIQAKTADTKATEAVVAAEATEGNDAAPARYVPQIIGKNYFQREKSCPFSGPRARVIDYKDARMLGRFISDTGKILPPSITGVSKKKQRELAVAIKRARMLGLLPFVRKIA